MEFDFIMRGRLFLEGDMIMVSRVMSFGDNANGQPLLRIQRTRTV